MVESTSVYKCRGPFLTAENRRGQCEEDSATQLLTLKVEEWVMCQGMSVASGSWRRQGNRFSPRASRKVNAAQLIPWFKPDNTHVEFDL